MERIIINEIISSNNKVSYSLIGIKRQIESIMTDINNNVDNNYIISQLKNINILINKINEDIKKINIKLNMSKLNDSKITNQNNKNERNTKEETPKNESAASIIKKSLENNQSQYKKKNEPIKNSFFQNSDKLNTIKKEEGGLFSKYGNKDYIKGNYTDLESQVNKKIGSVIEKNDENYELEKKTDEIEKERNKKYIKLNKYKINIINQNNYIYKRCQKKRKKQKKIKKKMPKKKLLKTL